MTANKGVDLPGQSAHNSRTDFFDRYPSFDKVDINCSTELAGLVNPVKETEFNGTLPNIENGTRPSAQLDLQCEPQLNQKPPTVQDASRFSSCSAEESGRINGAEFEMLSLDTISLKSPRIISSSSSPKLLVARKSRAMLRYLERPCKPLDHETIHRSLRKSSPIRKESSPTKIMYRPLYSQQTIHDLGHQPALEATRFEFGFQHNSRPLSPPPSVQVSESSNHKNTMVAGTELHDSAFTWGRRSSQQFSYESTVDLGSPLATPPADIATFRQSNLHTYSTNFIHTHSPRNQSSDPWASTPVTTEFNFEGSPAYLAQVGPVPIWWSDAAQKPLIEPLPTAYNHSTKSLAMQLQADLAYNASELELSAANIPSGLMIKMPNTLDQSFVADPSPTSPMDGGADLQDFFGARAAALAAFQPHHRQSLVGNYAQLDGKEKNKSHPLIESSSSSPRTRASPYHISKKRSFSRKHATEQPSGAHRTAKHSSGNSTVMAADFVNFTPNDSVQILMGVAPSGSSKTKARREKEAAEKTRRLSQAAVRAVQAVGGSIESLVEEGFVPPSELEMKGLTNNKNII